MTILLFFNLHLKRKKVLQKNVKATDFKCLREIALAQLHRGFKLLLALAILNAIFSSKVNVRLERMLLKNANSYEKACWMKQKDLIGIPLVL
jgi:hypothetical protein